MEKLEWHIEKRKLTDLKEYEHNPRRITEKGFNDLKKSLDKYGLAEPIVIQPSGLIIGGHARYKVLLSQGVQEADCYVANRELEEKEMQELNIRLNKNIAGEFDFDILANEFDVEELKEWGFEDQELIGLEENEIEEKPEVEFTEELLESHNYIVLYFDNEIDWLNLQSVYPLKTVQALDSKEGFKKSGIGRVVRGSDFINKIKNI